MRTIIIGAGKVGYSIAQMLSLENHDVVVIEQNEEREHIIQENLDVQTILGNGASIPALKEAGVAEAGLVIAVTEKDELNMVACLIAKSFGVPFTMARVSNPEYAEITKEDAFATFGIDLIINPEQVTAHLIAKLIDIPEAINVEYYAEGRVQLLELKLNPNAPIVNIKLKDLQLPPSILIAAVLRKEKMLIPKGNDVLLPGDHIFIMSETHTQFNLERMLGIRKTDVRNLIIIGGGRLGRYLASLLEKRNISIKIIDKDLEQCQKCTQVLTNVLVLHGDGTDVTLLKEENIGASDLFVAVTGDDKVNLLVCLLAKHHGAKRAIAQIRRSDYTSLVETVGVDIAVSPRVLAAGAILKFIRKGDIISITLLGGAKAEMMEVVPAEHSRIVGKPLKDQHFPEEAIIGSVVRNGKVFIPSGDTIIQPGDHVMVFALPEAVKKVENYFINR